jgi:hypothetical protein
MSQRLWKNPFLGLGESVSWGAFLDSAIWYWVMGKTPLPCRLLYLIDSRYGSIVAEFDGEGK